MGKNLNKILILKKLLEKEIKKKVILEDKDSFNNDFFKPKGVDERVIKTIKDNWEKFNDPKLTKGVQLQSIKKIISLFNSNTSKKVISFLKQNNININVLKKIRANAIAKVKDPLKPLFQNKMTAAEALLTLQKINDTLLDDYVLVELFSEYGLDEDDSLEGNMEQILQNIGYKLTDRIWHPTKIRKPLLGKLNSILFPNINKIFLQKQN
jgi:hypothetical protein